MEHTLTVIDADPVGRPGVGILAMRGDVDACDQAVLDCLRRGLSRANQVHLTLAGLRFGGASFLDFLADLACQVRARRGVLHLHDVPDRVVRLLTVAGMESQFDLVAVGEVTTLTMRPGDRAPPTSACA
jgi:anti-anti-sigma regulatory factor